MRMMMSSITWLWRSCGSKAIALPRRLSEGDGPDIDRVRDTEPHRDIESRHRPVGFDDGRRRRGRHVGQPGRGGELAQEGRVCLNVDGAAHDPDDHRRPPQGVARRGGRPDDGLASASLGRDVREPGVGRQGLRELVQDVRPDVAVGVDAADDVDLIHERIPDPLRLPLLGDDGVEPLLLGPHALELRLEHLEPRALGNEQEQPAAYHDHGRGARGQEPGVLDAREQPLDVGQPELEARAARRSLLLAGEEVDFDHAARLSARPIASIKSGATSSTDTVSNTASRCNEHAISTGTRRRLASEWLRPGTRAPPPIVYTRPRPPAERDAVARNAAARSTPTAISSARASTYCAKSALCVWP